MSEQMNLIVQYYRCPDAARQAEIDECLRQNLLNPYLTTIHLLTEEEFDFAAFPEPEKIRQAVIGERLTFERAFRYANVVDPDGTEIWILANADIYFDETLKFVESKNLEGVVYALTRHDVQADGTLQMVPSEYAHGCQDAWIFRTPVPLEKVFVSFYLGIPGCDHRIAYEFVKEGYSVFNPSLKIIIRHLDLVRGQDVAQRATEYVNQVTEDNIRDDRAVAPPYLYHLYPTGEMDLDGQELLHHYLERTKELALLNTKLVELYHQLSGIHQQMAQKDQLIIELNKSMIDMRIHFEEMRKQLLLQLDIEQKHLSSMYNSFSWKITKPFRLACDLLSGLSDK